jgi:hypothetical protein
MLAYPVKMAEFWRGRPMEMQHEDFVSVRGRVCVKLQLFRAF